MTAPTLRPRRLSWRRTLGAVVASLLLWQLTVSRGQVHGQDDGPLAGADIVVVDGGAVVARTRTGADGRFFVAHRPLLPGGDSKMLVCAPGLLPHVQSPAGTALFYSSYGLARRGRFEPSPARLGWRLPVPTACQYADTAPDPRPRLGTNSH